MSLARHRFTFMTLRSIGARIRPTELHALVCYLFESPQSADHRAQEKPFAVDGRIQLVRDERSTTIEMTVNWLDPTRDPASLVRRALGETPNLGREIPLRPVGWSVEKLAVPHPDAAQPATGGTIRFLTPTVMKTARGRPLQRPTAEAALRSVARRYSTFIDAVPRSIVSGITDTRWSPEEAGKDGFRGSLDFAITADRPELDRSWITCLLEFAALCGVGSSTRSGQGTVTTEAHTGASTTRG